MIIAGAGGHGLEVAFILKKIGIPSTDLYYFDEDPSRSQDPLVKDSLILSIEELKNKLRQDSRFVLGVGNPVHREKLFQMLSSLGGNAIGMNCLSNLDSEKPIGYFDALPYSFIGPQTQIGLGVLVNTRAHIHHECVVGDFSEIGPGAIVLGAAKIGSKCRIGAGAILLPGVVLGDEVVVGSGAVVTKSFSQQCVLVGIPAAPLVQ